MGISRGVLDTMADCEQLTLDAIPTRQQSTRPILVEPRFFDLQYAINPHMTGEVDNQRARTQWETLRAAYERHAEEPLVLDPAETEKMLASDAPPAAERPDMVFVANHALPTPEGGGFVLANMATEERAGEPAHFGAWAREEGYSVDPAPSASFEGAGDGLWHPGRRLLWGGYGVRSERGAYEELADRYDITVIPLELTDERYYHLDVCLAPLSESTALVQPEAFTDAGLAKIEAVFETVLAAPARESSRGLAVNVEVVDETVVLGADAPETAALLSDAGFEVVTVETSEFLKAGGSVCCLTLSGTPAA